jgi:hypothetical protein
MHAENAPAPTEPPDGPGQGLLLDIWGDTVSADHIVKALLISIAFAVGAFFTGHFIGESLVEESQIADAVSLLSGLLGCMAAGVVVAKFFKPKRILVEEVADSTSRAEAMATLAREPGGLGKVEDLDPAIAEEMRRLGLYDVFAEAEREFERTGHIPGVDKDEPTQSDPKRGES